MDIMEKAVQDDNKRVGSTASEAGEGSQLMFDKAVEKAYGKKFSLSNYIQLLTKQKVRKMDVWLLPFLSVMYFFNAVDRVSERL